MAGQIGLKTTIQNVKAMNYNYKELRNTTGEVRTGAKENQIVGLAIVFNSVTDLGWFKEMILPEAVTTELLRQDVRCLFNHDSNLITGRTTAGTLTLEKTARGLQYFNDCAPTSYGLDLIISLKRGDITGSSFGFSVAKGGDRWEKAADGSDLRIITKISRLYDVSPVTYPAYADTEAAARSFAEYQKNGNGTKYNAAREDIRRREIQLKQIQLEMIKPQPHRLTIAEAERQLKALKP